MLKIAQRFSFVYGGMEAQISLWGRRGVAIVGVNYACGDYQGIKG